MESIELNDYLCKENVWARRLLGLETFTKVRDLKQVEGEYNIDKYGTLLKYKLKTIEEYKVKEFELGGALQDQETVFSLKDRLFKSKLSLARTIYYQIIKKKIEQYRSENICELGCGYGYNLSYLNGDVYGGEYAENAVTLAVQLGMDVYRFNYYESKDYSFIKPNSTLFTVHSIEQIPDAHCIIDNLSVQKDKINYVVNFEPSLIPERSSLLGLFRNKYIQLNDYNRNLFSILQSRDDIEVIEYEQDIVGINPLNSANLIVWRFK